jgi:hypothetical protein
MKLAFWDRVNSKSVESCATRQSRDNQSMS